MSGAFHLPGLPYRKPTEGEDYWIVENALPDPEALVRRFRARQEWEWGFPRRAESWPGMRSRDALQPEELVALEETVKGLTGASRLWVERAPDGAYLNHNVVQVVAERESGPRPHTDSRRLCRYAAVVYLSPEAPPTAGTTFFRLRYPDGRLGGNYCPAPHDNLQQALGVKGLPLQAWMPELSLRNIFNRLVVYRADLVHSATRYFGQGLEDARMTALFFWMAE